jgi:hypothetical protein
MRLLFSFPGRADGVAQGGGKPLPMTCVFGLDDSHGVM